MQAEKTIDALLQHIERFKDKTNKLAFGVVSGHGGQEAGEHPRIPIVKNHPQIKELRLCHADYALIPTKNGINILEMISK